MQRATKTSAWVFMLGWSLMGGSSVTWAHQEAFGNVFENRLVVVRSDNQLIQGPTLDHYKELERTVKRQDSDINDLKRKLEEQNRLLRELQRSPSHAQQPSGGMSGLHRNVDQLANTLDSTQSRVDSLQNRVNQLERKVR